MGRILANCTLENIIKKKTFSFTGLIDMGASHVVLPSAWKDELGDLEEIRKVTMNLADQSPIQGSVCGPVRISLEGFEPVFSEIIFMDMKTDRGTYEPIIGYILLEQCQAAVDMLGHRLIPVKYLDMK